jgi:hypothetical protein
MTQRTQSPSLTSLSSPPVLRINDPKPSITSAKHAKTGASSWYVIKRMHYYILINIVYIYGTSCGLNHDDDQVINHGVPESLMKAMADAFGEFFNLTEEEKQEYGGKHVLDPIRYGTNFNTSVDKVLFWRVFLRIVVHPQYHSPTKPPAFRYYN